MSVNGEDVEIFFLHYHSEKEAQDKWSRRCERINFDRLIVKFNDQNGCTKEMVKAFLALPYKNKLFFTCKKWQDLEEGVTVIPQLSKKDFILASYEPFGKNRKIDITRFINQMK